MTVIIDTVLQIKSFRSLVRVFCKVDINVFIFIFQPFTIFALSVGSLRKHNVNALFVKQMYCFIFFLSGMLCELQLVGVYVLL